VSYQVLQATTLGGNAVLAVLCAIAIISQSTPSRDLAIRLGPGASFYGGEQGGPIREVSATGFFLRGDYVFRERSWFAPRLYGGSLDTGTQLFSCRGAHPCDVHTGVLFVGGALRFVLPIPWIAPFVELGGGPSFGRIATRYGPAVERGRSGVFGHIDFGFGLGLGYYHQLEIGVHLLDHPAMQNIGAGVAVGLAFPL
jgi:hypothetical protein